MSINLTSVGYFWYTCTLCLTGQLAPNFFRRWSDIQDRYCFLKNEYSLNPRDESQEATAHLTATVFRTQRPQYMYG